MTTPQGEKILWQGPLASEKQPVTLSGIRIEQCRAVIDFSSDTPVQTQALSADARQLSFALYDLSVTSGH